MWSRSGPYLLRDESMRLRRLWLLPLTILIFSTREGITTRNHSGPYIAGPGLTPLNFRLPCQYFRVLQAPQNDISVNIEGTIHGRSFPVAARIFRSTKDSYLIHYKPPPQVDSLRIRVFSNLSGQDVSGSPVFIPNKVSSSHCQCPKSHFEEWLQDSCGEEIDPQISSDFDFFNEEGGALWNVSYFIDVLKDRFTNPRSQSYCHYAIKNNEVYRECFGEHVGFNMFVDNILHYLTRIVVVPDVEFIINLGDWPLGKKTRKDPSVPIISWCKKDNFSDILWPTYDITEASLECMGRQEVHIFSVREKSNDVPWEDKIDKGFWRGRDSNARRLSLVQISKESPENLDAGITRYFFFRDKEKALGTKSQTSFFNFYKYKYLITVDGTVASYRLPYLLSGNSVVLKQDSEYYEHFYSQLRPYVHYIPIKEDLSDLNDQIEWARAHEETVREISENARALVDDLLLPDKIFCYHAWVLREWRRRLIPVDEFHLSPGMSHVPQPGEDSIYRRSCSCESSDTKDEL